MEELLRNSAAGMPNVDLVRLRRLASGISATPALYVTRLVKLASGSYGELLFGQMPSGIGNLSAAISYDPKTTSTTVSWFDTRGSHRLKISSDGSISGSKPRGLPTSGPCFVDGGYCSGGKVPAVAGDGLPTVSWIPNALTCCNGNGWLYNLRVMTLVVSPFGSAPADWAQQTFASRSTLVSGQALVDAVQGLRVVPGVHITPWTHASGWPATTRTEYIIFKTPNTSFGSAARIDYDATTRRTKIVLLGPEGARELTP